MKYLNWTRPLLFPRNSCCCCRCNCPIWYLTIAWSSHRFWKPSSVCAPNNYAARLCLRAKLLWFSRGCECDDRLWIFWLPCSLLVSWLSNDFHISRPRLRPLFPQILARRPRRYRCPYFDFGFDFHSGLCSGLWSTHAARRSQYFDRDIFSPPQCHWWWRFAFWVSRFPGGRLQEPFATIRPFDAGPGQCLTTEAQHLKYFQWAHNVAAVGIDGGYQCGPLIVCDQRVFCDDTSHTVRSDWFVRSCYWNNFSFISTWRFRVDISRPLCSCVSGSVCKHGREQEKKGIYQCRKLGNNDATFWFARGKRNPAPKWKTNHYAN